MDFRNGIVKISTGTQVGTGFLISPDGLIVTCSHVILSHKQQVIGEHPPISATVEFYAGGEPCQARLLTEYWRPLPQDIAILKVDEPIPHDAFPLPLGVYDGALEKPFHSFGYPIINPTGNLAAGGKIVNTIDWMHMKALQLRSQDIGPGHSGAPVWDAENAFVIGMINWHLQVTGIGLYRNTCLAIPSEALVAACPDLTLHPPVTKPEPSALPASRLHLPPLASHFVGREPELAQLQVGLKPGRIFTICGPGGMGKTALAAQALYQMTGEGKTPPQDFPDGVFYHTFYHQHEITTALAEVARFFGVDPRPDAAQAAREALYVRCALLYLDGAEEADDLRPLLELRGRCGVLITSRDRKHLALGEGLDLQPLALEEAVGLLQALGGAQAAGQKQAQELCNRLGCQPLAIRLAGGYIGETQEPVETYTAWLEGALESGERGH
jgi:hypothetical protein